MVQSGAISARRIGLGLVLGATLVVIAGCGGDGSSDAVSAPAPSAAAPVSSDVVFCFNQKVPLERLQNPTPATEFSANGKEALTGESVPDLGDLREWSIVDDQPKYVSLIRELSKPRDEGQGFVRTHRMIAISKLDAPNVQGWMMTAAQECELRRSVEGLNPATVTLDPDALPQPADREVRLLVTERECASGNPATGRVQAPLVEPASDAVRVVIGVSPQPGNQNCPGNPATPYTLALPEPLGDRPLLDATSYPEREITGPKGSRRN